MTPLPFSVPDELLTVVRPGILAFDSLRVADRDKGLDAALSAAEALLRAQPPSGRDAVRIMYRKTGLDPTRRRPSSEALLRRVLGGEGLPRINVLVDVCNWCSVEFQVPYGLYDLDQVQGAVVLRLGRDGEEYRGIRKDVVHVAGRLVLADDAGPFGNPSSDSARTMTSPATVRALVVVVAPADMPGSQLDRILAVTSERVSLFAGGVETARFIV